MDNFLHMPDPGFHGWVYNEENDDLEIKWMSLPIAPDSILCFANCSCVKGCSTFRCSCKKASLRCSDLCRCKECQNCSLEYEEEEDPKLEDIYEDSDESDNNDESDSDSDYTKAAEEPRITSEWETSVVYTESGAETDSSL